MVPSRLSSTSQTMSVTSFRVHFFPKNFRCSQTSCRHRWGGEMTFFFIFSSWMHSATTAKKESCSTMFLRHFSRLLFFYLYLATMNALDACGLTLLQATAPSVLQRKPISFGVCGTCAHWHAEKPSAPSTSKADLENIFLSNPTSTTV